MRKQDHVFRKQQFPFFVQHMAHINIVGRDVDVGIAFRIAGGLQGCRRDAFGEHVAQAGISPGLPVGAQLLFLFQRVMGEVEHDDECDFVLIEVVLQMGARAVGAEHLVDGVERAGRLVQILHQAEGHLVEVAADAFHIVADFQEYLFFLGRVGDVVLFAEGFECFSVSVGFLPEAGGLADSFFDGFLVLAVFGGKRLDDRLDDGRIDLCVTVQAGKCTDQHKADVFS